MTKRSLAQMMEKAARVRQAIQQRAQHPPSAPVAVTAAGESVPVGDRSAVRWVASRDFASDERAESPAAPPTPPPMAMPPAAPPLEVRPLGPADPTLLELDCQSMPGAQDLVLGELRESLLGPTSEGRTLADAVEAGDEIAFIPTSNEDTTGAASQSAPAALVADPRDALVYLAPMGVGEHRTLAALLSRMPRLEASDLHLMVGEPPTYRIGREMQRLQHAPLTAEQIETFLYAILTPEDKKRIEALSRRADAVVQMRDMDVMAEVDVVYRHLGARYRVNVALEERGVMLTIRLLPTQPPSIQALDLPRAIDTSLAQRSGLILVAGPTGAGKTTTLAALVQELTVRCAHNVITIEDPVEYRYGHGARSVVKQRQVGRDTHSFSTGLVAALRQDPDVIVVGELREHETMELALNAAQTGHLVLSTIHARSAMDVPLRIINMFPAADRDVIAAQVANVLELVVFQQLLPRLAGGRVPAIEVVPMTPGVRRCIAKHDTAELRQATLTAIREHGGISMYDSIRALVDSSAVDDTIAASVLPADDRERFERERKL